MAQRRFVADARCQCDQTVAWEIARTQIAVDGCGVSRVYTCDGHGCYPDDQNVSREDVTLHRGGRR